MDKVVFDGKEYTKASVLAEKFRYTPDYLGQLCRAKKVDARLVGRAWYINLDSLNAHRDTRYKAPEKSAEISPKKAINNYLSRIDVEPILKQKTVKIFKNEKGKLSEVAVKYEADDYALIPRVHREAVSVRLPVDPAGAEKMHIKNKGTAGVSFKAEPLPEVSLRGTLTVAGLPEITEDPIQVMQKEDLAEKEKSARAIPPVEHMRGSEMPKIKPKTVVVRPSRPKPIATAPSTKQVVIKRVHTAPAAAITQVAKAVPRPVGIAVKNIEPAQVVSPKPTPKTPLQFTPALVIKKEQKALPAPGGFVGLLAPVAAFVIALMVGTLIVSTNVQILANGDSYDSKLEVQAANLFGLYERLSW
jgi:hypothetical protein